MKYFGQFEILHCGQRSFRRLFCNKVIPASPDLFISKLRDFYRLEEDKEMVVPVFKKALLYGNNICIKDFVGKYSYFQLYFNSKRLCRQISNICGSASCSTIAFFYTNDVLTTMTLFAIWMSGQIAMPLMYNQRYSYISDLVKDKETKVIITPEKHLDLGRKLAIDHDIALLAIDHSFMKYFPFDINNEIVISESSYILEGTLMNEFFTQAGALISIDCNIETSNTNTLLFTHKDINSQMKSLVQASQISREDRILNVFTSHYIIGYVNTFLFPLSVGSTICILEHFDGNSTWSHLLNINMPLNERINVIIAEPEVYQILIEEYEKIFSRNSRMVQYIKGYCLQNIRLMVSCSGTIPPPLFSRWLEITGHTLLENKYAITTENVESTQSGKDIKSLSLKSSNVKIRVVDVSNTVLLESDGMRIKNLPTFNTVIGRLMISHAEENKFSSTGQIVSYQDGIFKIIGECSKN